MVSCLCCQDAEVSCLCYDDAEVSCLCCQDAVVSCLCIERLQWMSVTLHAREGMNTCTT